MPAVPLKLKNTPLRARPECSSTKVAVEQDRFDFGQKRIIAVNVRPARLHHADLGIGEVMDDLQQEVFRRSEIGVEDGDEFALRRFQSLGQRSRLVAFAIVAVMIA